MDFKSVYSENPGYALYKAFFLNPLLRSVSLKSSFSIFKNFFFYQFRSSFLPGRIPVSRVDHSLDEKIPFVTSWVAIYLDFIYFWLRMIAFFLRNYGRRAYKPIGEFIFSLGGLYAYAAKVYKQNLSTTKRPFYVSHPRFLLIHLLDPHLMCIPSLHVMVAVHAYTKFAHIARQIGEEEKLKEQILEMKHGALAICQAVLFVKQHSVNCIPASLYAMTCFTPELFPVEEAQAFTELLFSPAPSLEKAPKNCPVHPAYSPVTELPQNVHKEIRDHIIKLYHKFLSEKEAAASWDEPIVNFLKKLPRSV